MEELIVKCEKCQKPFGPLPKGITHIYCPCGNEFLAQSDACDFCGKPESDQIHILDAGQMKTHDYRCMAAKKRETQPAGEREWKIEYGWVGAVREPFLVQKDCDGIRLTKDAADFISSLMAAQPADGALRESVDAIFELLMLDLGMMEQADFVRILGRVGQARRAIIGALAAQTPK